MRVVRVKNLLAFRERYLLNVSKHHQLTFLSLDNNLTDFPWNIRGCLDPDQNDSSLVQDPCASEEDTVYWVSVL